MKKILSIIFALFCGYFYSLAGQNFIDFHYRDSILKIVDALPATPVRLAYLERMAHRHQYIPYNMFFATRLYTEAKKQKNMIYENWGAYYMAGCYDKKHDADSLAYWVDILERFAPEVGTYDYYLEQKAAISRALASKRQIEKAVYVAKETLKESMEHHSENGKIAAYNSLGCAYAVSSRHKEALSVFQKAYNSFTSQTVPFLKIDILSRLASMYGNMGKTDERFSFIQEMDSTLRDIICHDPETQDNWTNFAIDCETKYEMHFMNRKEFGEAQRHLDKAKSLLKPYVDPVFWVNIQLVQLQLYGAQGDWDKSIALTDEITPIILQRHSSTFGILTDFKAKKQYEKGDIDGAIATRRYLIHTQDSLDSAFSTDQLQQVKEIYHIDELLLEKQKIQDSIYYRVVIVLTILLSLMLAFYLYTRHLSRKIVIVEKKTTEAAMQAEADNMAKDRLKSEISHDVRTPLNVVGFAELITSSEILDSEAKREYGQMIQTNAESLLNYINTILELSRLESGKIQYKKEECDIVRLCHNVIQMVTEKDVLNGMVSLQVGIDSLIILTDKERFVSFLTSLLTPTEGDMECYRTTVRINYEKNKSILYFDVINSPLAKVRFESKTSLIRHEINAHFIHYFGGIYKVQAEAEEGPTISFTLPL